MHANGIVSAIGNYGAKNGRNKKTLEIWCAVNHVHRHSHTHLVSSEQMSYDVCSSVQPMPNYLAVDVFAATPGICNSLRSDNTAPVGMSGKNRGFMAHCDSTETAAVCRRE